MHRLNRNILQYLSHLCRNLAKFFLSKGSDVWYISVFPPVLFVIAVMGSAIPETNFIGSPTNANN